MSSSVTMDAIYKGKNQGIRQDIKDLTSKIEAQKLECEFYRSLNHDQFASLKDFIEEVQDAQDAKSDANKDEINAVRDELKYAISNQNKLGEQVHEVVTDIDDSMIYTNERVIEINDEIVSVKKEVEHIKDVIRLIQQIVTDFRHEFADMYRSDLFENYKRHWNRNKGQAIPDLEEVKHLMNHEDPYGFTTGEKRGI